MASHVPPANATAAPVENSVANRPDSRIILSVSTFITYTVLAVTLGGSTYTLFSMIPEIKDLGKQVNTLNTNIAVTQTSLDAVAGKEVTRLDVQVTNLTKDVDFLKSQLSSVNNNPQRR
jgi:predicted PurR-regulated permease PerM